MPCFAAQLRCSVSLCVSGLTGHTRFALHPRSPRASPFLTFARLPDQGVAAMASDVRLKEELPALTDVIVET